MSAGWHRTDYALRFRLGDRTLAARRLRLQARQFTLGESIARSDCEAPSLASLPRGVAGYLLRSAPGDGSGDVLQRANGTLRYRLGHASRHYVDLTGGFDAYLARNFSSKTRSTLQRKVRKFAEHTGGELEWKAYRTPDEFAAFHPLALAVSDRTYQEKLFASGLPRDAAFVGDMQARAARGEVRAYLLFDRGTPVAYLHLPADGDTLTYAYLGFLPEYREWSVGTVLQWLALKDLFDEGRFRYLDFTEGEGEHKKLFATGHVECGSWLVLKDRLSHRLLLRAHRATDRASRQLGRSLDRLGLKALARRTLRYGVRGLWSKAS